MRDSSRRFTIPATFALQLLFGVLGVCVASVLATPLEEADGDPSPPAERQVIVVAASEPAALAEAPAVGTSVRVGGEPLAELVAGGSDFYTAGACRIDTALPAGYPPPTVPGVIEVKHYPSARRAEVSGDRRPELASNFAFFRLFQHIQEREIAMTSPVEMDYAPSETDEEIGWTMSFLYRTPDMGEAGEAGYVTVVDRPAVVVLAIGIQGGVGTGQAIPRLEELKAWAAKLDGWEIAGPPRGLYYNGPNVPPRNRWIEAQIPIRRVAPAAEPTPAAPGAREVFLHEAEPTPSD
ncbi:MAG: heme-binding protein [Planctomycetota bacterium]